MQAVVLVPLGEYILNKGETYTHSFRITPITKAASNDSEFVKREWKIVS